MSGNPVPPESGSLPVGHQKSDVRSAEWRPDPTGRHELRYWSGREWSNHVSNSGVVQTDPMTQRSSGAGEIFLFQLKRCTYLGSHPSAPDAVDRVGVGFFSKGFMVYNANRSAVLHTLEWDTIRQVRVEAEIDVQARITTTRVVLLGALGFFLKKTKQVAFLSIEDGDGEWMFGVEDSSPARLTASLQPVRARYPKPFRVAAGVALEPAPPERTTADRLATLQSLYEQQLLSEAELTERRRAIIDAI